MMEFLPVGIPIKYSSQNRIIFHNPGPFPLDRVSPSTNVNNSFHKFLPSAKIKKLFDQSSLTILCL